MSTTVLCFFLAGPLSGGGDWQSCMWEALLKEMTTAFTVAISYGLHDRPESSREPFSQFTELQADARTDRQLAWERHYLDLAAGAPLAHAAAPQPGCIVFWLPEESAGYPKDTAHGPYALDTRGELGEWRGRLMYDSSLRVVVGGDSRFPGFNTMERNFMHALGDECIGRCKKRLLLLRTSAGALANRVCGTCAAALCACFVLHFSQKCSPHIAVG